MSISKEAILPVVPKDESYSKNPFMYIHNQLEDVGRIVINPEVPESERQIAMRKRKLLLDIADYIRNGHLYGKRMCSWGNMVSWESEYLHSLTIKGYAKTCDEYKIEYSDLVSMAQAHAFALICDIGSDLDELLAENKIDEAEGTFRYSSNYGSSKPFAEYVRKVLPKAEDVSDYSFVSLEDMSSELNFLYYHCLKRIRQQIDRLDSSHLRMLLYIMEAEDVRFAAEQGLILSFLSKSECDISGLFNELRKPNAPLTIR